MSDSRHKEATTAEKVGGWLAKKVSPILYFS
jgi:hypothetical protein